MGTDNANLEDDASDLDDEWCVECGDPFHYDDCGGYNPPCECGMHCRDCHDAMERSNNNDGFGYDVDDHNYYPEADSDV